MTYYSIQKWVSRTPITCEETFTLRFRNEVLAFLDLINIFTNRDKDTFSNHYCNEFELF